MNAIQIILGLILLVLCVIVIVAMTVKEPKGKGLSGSISGEGNSFMDRNGNRTKDAMLSRAVTICGIALCVVTLILLFVTK